MSITYYHVISNQWDQKFDDFSPLLYFYKTISLKEKKICHWTFFMKVFIVKTWFFCEFFLGTLWRKMALRWMWLLQFLYAMEQYILIVWDLEEVSLWQYTSRHSLIRGFVYKVVLQEIKVWAIMFFVTIIFTILNITTELIVHDRIHNWWNFLALVEQLWRSIPLIKLC